MEAALNQEGIYFGIEGPDCSGKGTQSKLLISKLESYFPERKLVVVREPGGTDIGEQIRDVLLSHKNSDMTRRTELLLFSAGRAQLIEETVEPALKQGRIVFTERYFLSSLVYQGIGLGLGVEKVQMVSDFAVDGRWPDATYIIDIPAEETKRRLEERKHGDRIELRPFEFHQKVRDGYLYVASQHPESIQVIDGMQSIEEVHKRIWLSTLDKMYETGRMDHQRYLDLRK